MNERILIIEDDQAILKLLQRGLAYEGYTVDTAMDGRTGLILARDHTPDLVYPSTDVNGERKSCEIVCTNSFFIRSNCFR